MDVERRLEKECWVPRVEGARFEAECKSVVRTVKEVSAEERYNVVG